MIWEEVLPKLPIDMMTSRPIISTNRQQPITVNTFITGLEEGWVIHLDRGKGSFLASPERFNQCDC